MALACTELPLLIKGEVARVRAYDTAREHIKNAVNALLGHDGFSRVVREPEHFLEYMPAYVEPQPC